MDTHTTGSALTSELRSVLLELARRQDDLAAHEAAATPSWAAPCPSSVLGRRSAAAVLRAEADHLVTAS